MPQQVSVLLGGFSAERDVSLESGRGVVAALKEKGYEVTPIDVRRDIGALIDSLKDADVVFNALHGRYGEDGCIQGLLDMLKIPYTHSGRLASGIAMDKPLSKKFFAKAGIPVADSSIVTQADLRRRDVIEPPFVLKPLNEGSSVGVKIILTDSDLDRILGETWPYTEEVMIEKYVPGRELTVAILNGKPLGVLEIAPNEGFYDYETKYTDGKAIHIIPAELPQAVYDKAMSYGQTAFECLDCKGIARADFRYDPDTNALIILEINTQPGMTPLSLAPEIAAYAGYSYADLCATLVEEATCDS